LSIRRKQARKWDARKTDDSPKAAHDDAGDVATPRHEQRTQPRAGVDVVATPHLRDAGDVVATPRVVVEAAGGSLR
jgi:hypothetical protein